MKSSFIIIFITVIIVLLSLQCKHLALRLLVEIGPQHFFLLASLIAITL